MTQLREMRTMLGSTRALGRALGINESTLRGLMAGAQPSIVTQLRFAAFANTIPPTTTRSPSGLLIYQEHARWSETLLREHARPPRGTTGEYRIIYRTADTASGLGSTETILEDSITPAEYVRAMGWDAPAVKSIVWKTY